MNTNSPVNYPALKKLAKPLGRSLGIQHCKMIEALARAAGYKDLNHIAALWKDTGRPFNSTEVPFEVWARRLRLELDIDAALTPAEQHAWWGEIHSLISGSQYSMPPVVRRAPLERSGVSPGGKYA